MDGGHSLRPRCLGAGRKSPDAPRRGSCFGCAAREQPHRQSALSAALAAFVESTREDETEKSRLCPAHPLPDTPLDWLSVTSKGQRIEAAWAAEPDIAAWLERSRLNFSRGVTERLADPAIQAAVGRIFENRQPAIENLEKLLAQSAQAHAPA